MLTIKEYVKVTSLEQAYELNQHKSSCVLGGMLWLKMSHKNVKTAIDLSGLGLDQIKENKERFEIGAMTSLRDLELHAGLHAYTKGSLKECLRSIVGVQFRNTATLGGSIYGRFGFSDVLTLFLGMDTFVELYQGGIVPLSEFIEMKYDKDILIRIIVEKKPLKMVYLSQRNTKTDFPVLCCAISKLGNQFQAVVGARPHRAMIVKDCNIIDETLGAHSAQVFAEYVADQVIVGSNLRASSAYRAHLVEVLVRRGLLTLLEVEYEDSIMS